MKKLLLIFISIVMVLTLSLFSCAPKEDDGVSDGDVTVDEPADQTSPDDTDNTEDDSSDDEGLKVGDIEDSPPPSVDFGDLQ